MYDINNECILDIDVCKHLNERVAFLDRLHFLKKGDIALFDRGYYSIELFKKCNNRGIKVLFRLKCDAFREIVAIANNSRDRIGKIVVINGVKMRIVKHKIGDKSYYYATNMWNSTIETLEDLYWKGEMACRRIL